MKLSFAYIDIAKCQSAKQVPEELIKRTDGKVWIVVSKPVEIGAAADVSKLLRFNAHGAFIRIELFPYCSVGADLTNVVGHATSVGFAAADAIHNAGQHTIDELHLSIGTPVASLKNYLVINNNETVDCFRYWLGIAAKIK